jgi:hypothetical protein
MAFQPVPDGVEVVLSGLQNGVPIVNVYNVLDTETHDEARLGEIADLFKTWWSAHIQPNISDSYTLQTIKATNLTSSAGPQVIRTYTTANAGALSGGQVAGNGAAVISWRTALIGRSFRGRTYVGGLAESGLANAQFLTSGFATDLAGAGVALLDGLDGIGAKLAVLSRFVAGVARVAGLLTEIIAVIVDTKVDSQRRRTAN